MDFGNSVSFGGFRNFGQFQNIFICVAFSTYNYGVEVCFGLFWSVLVHFNFQSVSVDFGIFVHFGGFQNISQFRWISEFLVSFGGFRNFGQFRTISVSFGGFPILPEVALYIVVQRYKSKRHPMLHTSVL